MAAVYGYIFVVNIVAFAMMGIDKKRARNGEFRIRERSLWLAALAGGAVGATFGMNFFRHKTKHTTFRFGFPFLALLETTLILYLVLFY
ncbi:DUF1294 domain-containing protein [Neobacillus piezotolerans]|uniref:DUF1294 domain-containing protein n=1 Tax=Neobacillus piezotolerans TaxID=2259171 RepID=A0A3D8GP32_9BACI|nr:DUF1294 domain-containing protein [Neobacillus piezotolerans]RDU36240.1 DUF1294 domain-containing protein [Neobacillus piezotolerans]